MLEQVKLLLGMSSSTDKDELIESIIDIVEKPVLLYVNEPEVPIELQFIVIELAVARYNRLGSEGLSAEKIDVISNTYESDILKPYYGTLNEYNNRHKGAKKVVFV